MLLEEDTQSGPTVKNLLNAKPTSTTYKDQVSSPIPHSSPPFPLIRRSTSHAASPEGTEKKNLIVLVPKGKNQLPPLPQHYGS